MKIARTIETKAYPASTVMAGEVFRMHGEFYMVVDHNVFEIYLSGVSLPRDRRLIIDLNSGILYQVDAGTSVFPVNANLEVSE